MEKITVLNIVVARVWGGGEQYVYDTARAMGKKGVKVYIAVDKSNSFMQQKFSEVGQVVTCNLYSLLGLKSLGVLKNFIKKNEIRIINVHSGRAMLLSILLKKMTKASLVVFKHNVVGGKKDFYHKWQRKNVDAYICVSKLVYDLQVVNIEKENYRKYHLVYNGIDVDKFNFDMKFINKGNFKIGYAGRIAPDKGIELLLKALSSLKEKYSDIKLLLAGNAEKNYFKSISSVIKANHLEDSVEYIGYIHDMKEFYSQINVFVLPSVVKEAFGLVLCEAMCSGVPVITTDSGAQVEIINDKIDGFIVSSGNHNAIAEMIENVYTNKVDISKIVASAREKVLYKFNINNCVDKIIAIYLDC